MTENVASTYPFAGRMKNWTPLLACWSVRLIGLVGSSFAGSGASMPLIVAEKVLVIWSTATTEKRLSVPVAERSGVL